MPSNYLCPGAGTGEWVDTACDNAMLDGFVCEKPGQFVDDDGNVATPGDEFRWGGDKTVLEPVTSARSAPLSSVFPTRPEKRQ